MPIYKYPVGYPPRIPYEEGIVLSASLKEVIERHELNKKLVAKHLGVARTAIFPYLSGSPVVKTYIANRIVNFINQDEDFYKQFSYEASPYPSRRGRPSKPTLTLSEKRIRIGGKVTRTRFKMLFQKLEELKAKHRIPDRALCDYIGVHWTTLSSWRCKGTKPNVESFSAVERFVNLPDDELRKIPGAGATNFRISSRMKRVKSSEKTNSFKETDNALTLHEMAKLDGLRNSPEAIAFKKAPPPVTSPPIIWPIEETTSANAAFKVQFEIPHVVIAFIFGAIVAALLVAEVVLTGETHG